jgi:hypothetical protein
MWPLFISLRLALSGKPARKVAGRRRPGFRRLLVESLEDRTVPSGASLAAYGQLPLSFEANHGQTAAPVDYLSRGQGYTLFLMPSQAVLALSQGSAEDVLRMRLVGANPAAQALGLDQQAGVSNYLLGNDPGKWITNVPHFGRVAYQGVYPGINLFYYGNSQTQLEYDFDVAPGARAGAIQLAFQGVQSMSVNGQGDLVLHTAGGDVTEQAPVAYQMIDGVRQMVWVHYVLEANGQVGFALGTYDQNQSLIIDPVLSYSTYLGGSGGITGSTSIAVDGAGSAYITGSAINGFPTTAGAFQTTGSGSAFVTKLNPSGTALVYSTYLGGFPASGGTGTGGTGIALDSAGDAYITGWAGPSFPTTPGAFQPTIGSTDGAQNAFVAELNASGSALVYSTYLGGSGGGRSGFGYAGDYANAIALDTSGDAYVTGAAVSSNFPTTPGALQTMLVGSKDVFVTEVNSSGSALVYSTYLGMGKTIGGGTSISVDSAGNTYVTGVAISGFPTTPGAFETTDPAVDSIFVAKLNPGGTALMYSTYLGGSGGSAGTSAIALDSAGDAFITGGAGSGFPTTAGAFQRTDPSSDLTGFVAELNASGSGLVFGTYLGGSYGSNPAGIALDSAGDAYVTGWTNSLNFPTTPNAFQKGNNSSGGTNAFVTELNGAGSALVYSTYLGGGGEDLGNAIAVDSTGSFYITGQADSTNFPTTAGAFQTAFPGNGNVSAGFVAKFAATPSFAVSGFPSPVTAGTAGSFTVTALNADGTVNTGYTGTVTFSSSDPQALLPANYTFTAADQGVHTFTATLTTAGSQSITAADTAIGSVTGSDTGITVNSAAAVSLLFSNVFTSTTAGSAFNLTLTAQDAYGNTTPNYTGTVHFTSSDARAVLPANYMFTSSDAGQHSFSITFKKAGTQSVTATDTATGSLTATANGIVVNAAAASQFILSAPSSVTSGSNFSVTLTVADAYGNVVTGYTGTDHFSSSDRTATLPKNYTFTAPDAGVHTFTGVILRKKGKQTLTVTDIVNTALTATDTISVG